MKNVVKILEGQWFSPSRTMGAPTWEYILAHPGEFKVRLTEKGRKMAAKLKKETKP